MGGAFPLVVADGAWHCTAVIWDRSTNLARIFHDDEDEDNADISSIGSLSTPGFPLRVAQGSNGNTVEIAYMAVYTGSNAEGLNISDFRAFWQHGKINTSPSVAYTRAGATFSDVGVDPGFGVRVAGWREGVLPIGHSSAFSHTNKLGAAFYGSATNSVLYSQDLSAWPTKISTTALARSGEAPDGSRSSTKVTATANDGYIQCATYAVTVNADTTASCYIRRNGASDVTGRLIVYDVAGDAEEATLAFTATSDWQRIRIHNANAASTQQAVRIEIDTSGQAVDVWGAQAEEGNSMTPYIQTSSAAATRGVPSCSLDGTLYYSSTRGEVACNLVFEYLRLSRVLATW